MGRDVFYITTPIYYANDVPHIGHAYNAVATDFIARYHRLRGERVFHLTGTDEHGLKVQRAAEANGVSPKEWVDALEPKWRSVWASLDIAYDDYIRTTEPRHAAAVSKILQAVHDNGRDDIYLGHYEAPPGAVEPATRRNEVLSLLRGGLQDFSISRTTFDWGVPLPWDTTHVTYVWFDALTNYITAAGYVDDPARFAELWPANVHSIGKDILRFHAVYWPAMLMAAGIEPPTQVWAHGYLTVGGKKMSKTNLTGIHPSELLETFGVDSYRYFWLRQIAWGADGDFSWEAMVDRHNADLANGLGNLASRVLAMLGSYFEGVVPPVEVEGCEADLPAVTADAAARYDANVLAVELQSAVAAVWSIVDRANGYLVEKEPWKLAKDPDRRAELASVLYASAELLRIVAVLIQPIMPGAAQRLWDQLGLPGAVVDQRVPEAAVWGGLEPGTLTHKGESLFPRLDTA